MVIYLRGSNENLDVLFEKLESEIDNAPLWNTPDNREYRFSNAKFTGPTVDLYLTPSRCLNPFNQHIYTFYRKGLLWNRGGRSCAWRTRKSPQLLEPFICSKCEKWPSKFSHVCSSGFQWVEHGGWLTGCWDRSLMQRSNFTPRQHFESLFCLRVIEFTANISLLLVFFPPGLKLSVGVRWIWSVRRQSCFVHFWFMWRLHLFSLLSDESAPENSPESLIRFNKTS